MATTGFLTLNGQLFLVSGLFLIGASVANNLVPLLPIGGLTLIVLATILWLFSLCATFILLHKLLLRKEPFSSVYCQNYLKYVGISIVTSTKDYPKTTQIDCDNIKSLTVDIDKYFISKWYSGISENADFPSESRAFLDESLNRLIEVLLQLNYTSIFHGALNVFLRHLKEFRRTLKRREKYGNMSIEELYRYSHVCSISNSSKCQEYFVHHLTIGLLRHFINSELWNSLPCHVLVSVLARKLVGYLLATISDPELLNHFILSNLASKEVGDRLKLSEYGRIRIEEFFDVVEKEAETELKAKELQMKVEQASKVYREANGNEKPTVILRKKALKPQLTLSEKSSKKSGQVKIHESKGSAKTWRDSRDLACISLGQDPLDGLISPPDSGGKMGPKQQRFFDSAGVKGEEFGRQDCSPSASHLFNEMMQMTSMEGFKTSIKPLSDVTERTLHNIKDLQEATVNNALHKIGDFQDEAAGVVEGILDFGRQGFRKGLRLTGLQDNAESAKPTKMTKVKGQLEELKSFVMEKTGSSDSGESVWINPLRIDSPNYDGQILLEKDFEPSARVEDLPIPLISTEDASGTESPDPEYEDTADLASSIAKLRSLLQQRSSESNLSTPALSPMPDDYVVLKQTESDSEALEVDGMMPSFYKFCTKTASGVLSNTLNTIKTALPSSNIDNIHTVELWKFVSNCNESETLTRMKKLLTERKEYCVLDKEIDAAYDALDSVDVYQQSPNASPDLQFEDELDDFEGKIPLTKTLVDIVSELLADTDSFLIRESAVKALLLLFGSSFEATFSDCIDKAKNRFRTNLFSIPESTNSKVLTMSLEDYVDNIEKSVPDSFKFFIGESDLRNSAKLLIGSLQKSRINRDVVFQCFELVAMKLIEETLS